MNSKTTWIPKLEQVTKRWEVIVQVPREQGCPQVSETWKYYDLLVNFKELEIVQYTMSKEIAQFPGTPVSRETMVSKLGQFSLVLVSSRIYQSFPDHKFHLEQEGYLGPSTRGETYLPC